MGSAERRLQKLERSEVFAPDFPRRRHLTHAQWADLSEDEQIEAGSSQMLAIRRAKDCRALVELIGEIGEARQESAVPLLARLWSGCALVPARTAAGHALRAIGSREARAALLSLIEDADHLSVFLAIRAVFDDDPASAFDRFAPYFEHRRVSQPGGRVIPREILRTFGHVWREERTAGEHWTMREPGWFGQDERWMDLCVRLRRDEHLGDAARDVLRVADPSRVKARQGRRSPAGGAQILSKSGVSRDTRMRGAAARPRSVDATDAGAAWRINKETTIGERMGRPCALGRCYRSRQSENGSAE
jgi:hypothetical protein